MGINYKMLRHTPTFTSQQLAQAEHVSGYIVAKPVIVRWDLGYAMCVVPACMRVDLDLAAEALLSLDVQLATEREMLELFPNCELGSEPPIGTMYGIKTVVDEQLHRLQSVVMQAGNHEESVEIRREDWEKLCDPIVARISRN
jgi:Ala-tRNA(Pro) deacylase